MSLSSDAFAQLLRGAPETLPRHGSSPRRHFAPTLRNGASDRAGEIAMTDTRLGHLFWRVADQLDYLVTLAWLRILDALAGPLPETPADQRRKRDRMERPRSAVIGS